MEELKEKVDKLKLEINKLNQKLNTIVHEKVSEEIGPRLEDLDDKIRTLENNIIDPLKSLDFSIFFGLGIF